MKPVPPRAVDWLLLTFVLFELLSGYGSFLVGKPDGAWFFVLHGIVGLGLVLLLIWKLRRVFHRIVSPARWRPGTAVGVLTLIATLATLFTGLWWTVAQRPLGYPNGMILHTAIGTLLALVCLWHFWVRFRPLPAADMRSRRTALGLFVVALTGILSRSSVEQGNRTLQTDGAARRFTGSREEGMPGEGVFPVTMWLLDNPPPLDLAAWRLRVDGAAAAPFSLSYEGLLAEAQETLEATLDCTGGWYSTQPWQGVRVGRLLEQAAPAASARYVCFISVTGYRWSLPMDEARDALLATHVAGQPLSHGHGAPLRLVAPGRRGFQWVKWVVSVEVLERPDAGQWAAIFLSGLKA